MGHGGFTVMVTCGRRAQSYSASKVRNDPPLQRPRAELHHEEIAVIIQAPRETILRCDAPRCGNVDRLHPVTEIEARLWMSRERWQTTAGQKHFCAACCAVKEKAA